MGFLSKFEGRMEDTLEGAADKMFDAPISPVQIAKKAEKQMRREKMVGAGKQYAPTLYTVLVNADDDERLFGYYPTLAGETETYLMAKAAEQGLVMDGQPLVRFIVDEDLKHGKFDIIAEAVAAPIVAQLRQEEMQRYGLAQGVQRGGAYAAPQAGAYGRAGGAAIDAGVYAAPLGQQAARGAAQPMAPLPQADAYDAGFDDYVAPVAAADQQLPYVPEEEIDYSVDYGEYTYNSRDFDDYQNGNAGFDQPDEFAQPAAYAGDDFSDYANGANQPGVPAAQPAFAGRGAAAAAAGYAAGAAGGVVGGTAGAVAPDTVVFAGGAQAATPVPAQAAVHARLTDTTHNRSYDLASSRLLIGRESKNDIVVPDINASRTHAELRLEAQGVWVLTDLGSTNGTFVNGREIAAQPLVDGDRITIGTTNYVFNQA